MFLTYLDLDEFLDPVHNPYVLGVLGPNSQHSLISRVHPTVFEGFFG